MGLSWPDLLTGVIGGEDLTPEIAADAIGEVMDGDVATEVTAGFLVAMAAKGETGPEIAGMAAAMRDHALQVPVAGPLLDTCGTGGDRHGTVNVSTMAALVCAGAGARVAKHGNRAASSKCGSADVLEELGVKIDLGPDGVASCIDAAGIGFCLATVFHPAMKHVVPVRKALGVRTVFNFLGPLANPARATHQVVGVPDPRFAPLMATALGALGAEHALVVHGADGLDELSTTGTNRVWEYAGGEVTRYDLEPAAYGLDRASLDDLLGDDAATNARILRGVLDGESGPVRDIVVLNAAAALVAADLADDVGAGMAKSEASIDTGAARRALDRLVEVSNEL